MRVCGIPHKHEKSTIFIPSPLSLIPQAANTLALEISSNEEDCVDEDKTPTGSGPSLGGSSKHHQQAENSSGNSEKAKEEFDSVIPPRSNYLLDISIEKSKAQLLTKKRHSSQLLKSNSNVSCIVPNAIKATLT